jgi:DNA-binding XRE family transcriptional regulator
MKPKDICHMVRLFQNLSQRDFAKRYGKTAQTIHNWENGKTKIPIEVWVEISEFFRNNISGAKVIG